MVNAIHNNASFNQIGLKNVTYIHSSGKTYRTNETRFEQPVDGVENSNGGTLLYQDDREYLQNITISVNYEGVNNTYNLHSAMPGYAGIFSNRPRNRGNGENDIVFNDSFLTNLYGDVYVTLPKEDLIVGDYKVTAVHPEDWNYKEITNTTRFTILPNVDLSVNKTSDKFEYFDDDIAVWTITVSNANNASNASDVVIDDIVLFTNGNQIYTDSIVLEGNVEVNESMITGESDAISKKPGSLLYSGSFVVSGTAYARVENVGKNNYIEKLASEAKKQKGRKSELLNTLNWIIKVIGFLILPLFAIQLVQAYSGSAGRESFESFNLWFQASIANVAGSIVGLIPSGLFLLTSIALFSAIWRLGKKNNTLVQEAYCIEMLARVDTLCLDKTGTITDGTMRVVDCVEVDNKTEYSIREIVGSMMSAFEDSNATSEAIIRFFSKNDVLDPEVILPFSSKRKYSAVTFRNAGTFYLGAPEFILYDNYKKVQSKIEKYASQGCRVLALGHTTTGIRKEGIAANVRPIALIVIQDHIREEGYDTIQFFKENGVDIKVISGDNPITVSEIAKRVGVPNAHRYISLEGLSDDEVKDIAFDYSVFGRVTPNQKKALVEAFKAGKRTVAMTGDGVNDILAMKESDCSIAMASGSEATRTVANLVLMDSNFASMPAVVAEGRRVINNIQRTSTLFLVKTLFTFFLTIFYLLLGSSVSYPFQPSQLTLIEVVIIGLPAAVISLQPNKERVQGHFIQNVIKSSLPGALTVLFFHIGVWLLTKRMDIAVFPSFKAIGDNPELYHSVLLIITVVIIWAVLLRMCKPFNWLKGILFAFVSVVTFLCLSFSHEPFLNFGPIQIGEMLGLVPLEEIPLLFVITCLLLINAIFGLIDKLLLRLSKVKL